MAEIGAWNLFMEWKVFDKIPDSESISFEELAASVDAEPGLVCKRSCPSPLPSPQAPCLVGRCN